MGASPSMLNNAIMVTRRITVIAMTAPIAIPSGAVRRTASAVLMRRGYQPDGNAVVVSSPVSVRVR